MEYLVKNDPEDINLSNPEHDLRLAEVIIRIGTTKITAQILECSLCEKNFYLGHGAFEHFLIPVSKDGYPLNTSSLDETIDLGEISEDDSDHNNSNSNAEALHTSDIPIYTPQQPETPTQPADLENFSITFLPPKPVATTPTLPTEEVELNHGFKDEKRYRCSVCEKSFGNLNEFKDDSHDCHLTNADEQIVDDPTLSQQDTTLSQQDTTKDKESKDIETKDDTTSSDTVLCTLCGLKFSCPVALKRHSKVHKAEQEKQRRKLVCEICNRTLADKSSMEQHMDIHLDLKNFKCTYCGRMFRQKNNLIRHNRIHTGEKPHLCSICGKGFYDKTDLTRHFRIHTGEKPYKCDVCDRTFSTPGKLKGHKNTHSKAATVECPICEKKLSCSYTLKSHMIIHTGDSSSKCNVCNKVFAKNHKLKRHMMTHTGEKPFICLTCGNRFRNRYNMTEHMKIHVREKHRDVQQPSTLPPPLDSQPSQSSVQQIYLDVTNQQMDSEVEHHIHLPDQHGIKIGILQTDRKFNIEGDFIELNYVEGLQLGLQPRCEMDLAVLDATCTTQGSN